MGAFNVERIGISRSSASPTAMIPETKNAAAAAGSQTPSRRARAAQLETAMVALLQNPARHLRRRLGHGRRCRDRPDTRTCLYLLPTRVLDDPAHQLGKGQASMHCKLGHERRRRHARLRVHLKAQQVARATRRIVEAEVSSRYAAAPPEPDEPWRVNFSTNW